jgi:hypothetical protein
MPTTHTLKNPTVITNPIYIDLDKAIEDLRVAIAAVPWLEKPFHRAKEIPLPNPDGKGGIIRVPMVYQSGKEYYPVMPNDALRSYSFFRTRGPKEFVDYSYSAPEPEMLAPMDLIVWVNLGRLNGFSTFDPTFDFTFGAPDYNYLEILERDIVKFLNGYSQISIKRIWDDRVSDIFSGYTLNETQRDLLMFPYQAFRIEFDLSYSMICQDETGN